MKAVLSPFAYAIRKKIEMYDISKHTFYLSVSGGKDSMVLLHAFYELQQRWKPLTIRVFHVHHGKGINEPYRHQAKELVRTMSQSMGFTFVTNVALPTNLKSEEEFRDFRRSEWQKAKEEGALLVTAHHADDLFETRLLRMIRGTGANGLIAMQVFTDYIFRPFLDVEATEVSLYAQKHNISFVDDPSNLDTKYFRNWLRHQFLPSLESYQAGSVKSFRQSLETISSLWSTEKNDFFSVWIVEGKIKRQAFFTLDLTHQLQILAEFLKRKNIVEYRRSQLEEIAKLLDRSQNDYTFNLLGCEWRVSAFWVEILVHD